MFLNAPYMLRRRIDVDVESVLAQAKRLFASFSKFY